MGHDIRRIAGFGEYPVDPFGGADVLPKLGDGLIGCHQCIQGVHARPGHGGCVGTLAVVGHLDLGYADTGHTGEIDIRRVHHHGSVHAVKRAFLRHQFLAAALLFRRRAQVANSPGQAGA